jgi:hypothetical protein
MINDGLLDGPCFQTLHCHRQCPLYLQSWLFFTPKEWKGGVCGMDLWCPLLRTPLPLNVAGHICGFVEALHYCFLRLTYRNPALSYAQYFCCRVGGRGIFFSNVIAKPFSDSTTGLLLSSWSLSPCTSGDYQQACYHILLQQATRIGMDVMVGRDSLTTILPCSSLQDLRQMTCPPWFEVCCN